MESPLCGTTKSSVPLRGPSGPLFLAPAHLEVPQIQFFDNEVVDQFQFIEKVFGGTGFVQRKLSMLDGVQYI